MTLVELGRLHQDAGFNKRAEPLLREALAIRRKVLGEEHGEIANSLTGVASVLRLNGDLAGAEAMLRDSLERNRRIRGEDHPNTGTTLHDLALVVAARGDTAAAESLFRQALDVHRKALGDKHPNVASTQSGLSRVLLAQGRYDEAIASLNEAMDIARAGMGRDHQLLAIYTINLASVHLARGTPNRPRRCFEKACASVCCRPGWSRAADACSRRTTGASAAPRACSVLPLSRSGGTARPRRCCSPRGAISSASSAAAARHHKNDRPPDPALRRLGEARSSRAVSRAARLLADLLESSSCSERVAFRLPISIYLVAGRFQRRGEDS